MRSGSIIVKRTESRAKSTTTNVFKRGSSHRLEHVNFNSAILSLFDKSIRQLAGKRSVTVKDVKCIAHLFRDWS